MIVSEERILIFLQFFTYLSITQSNFVTFVSELKVTCNPHVFVCKSWVTYTKENDTSTYLINIDYDIITPRLNFQFLNLKIFTNPIGRRNESKKVMDINADVCKFFKKNNGANPFTTYLISLTQRNGKAAGCPMKMEHYYVHNLTINGMGVPNFAGYFLGRGEGSLQIKYSAKLGKRSVSTMNISIVGGYRNEK